MFGREMRDNRPDDVMRDEALRIARECDVIVAAMGEPSEMSGESSSRSDLSILDAQKDLLIALKATGKPIVLLNFSGRATVMDWEVENIPTILNVWFGGSEAADAICDVVFGDVAPSGKLTVTMPRNVGQIPIYYNHLNTGRPNPKWFSKYTSNYLDVPNDPLFPFGYGLSYSTFRYSNLKVSDTLPIRVSAQITNTSQRDAVEIAQLYIRDRYSAITRPVKELKGFKRVALAAGETKQIEFVLTRQDLQYIGPEMKPVFEPGEFDIMVGASSRDEDLLKQTINIDK